MKSQKSTQPATDKDLRHILGSAKDDLVSAVRGTGATYDEVMQACAWMDDDDFMGKQGDKHLSGASLRVYELLAEDRDRCSGGDE